MKKWLFQSQDYVWFLLGTISGFGINLITWKLSDLSITYGIIGAIGWILGFFLYKFWISTKDEFDFYITHWVWEKKPFDHVQTWICKDTDEYQLVEWNPVVKNFKESWTKIFPDNENNESCQLFLKRNGIVVREFTWIYCDGWRVFMPLPDSKNVWGKTSKGLKIEYSFQKDSLKFRMLHQIWDYWREESFERLLERAGIKIYD
jgi:hypothetical protein